MNYGRVNGARKVETVEPTPTQTKEVEATSFPVTVTPDEGYVLSEATVTAPANLTPENIKKGVSIAGVVGTFRSNAELTTKTIKPTEFPTEVTPGGYYDGLTKVTIQAPDNLTPENIRNGVEIAGVVGTMSAEGMSEGMEFWMRMLQDRGIRKDSDGNYVVNNLLKEYWPSNILISGAPVLALSSYILADKQLVNVELPESATDERISIPSYCFQGSGGKISSQPYMTVTGSPNNVYNVATAAFRQAKLEAVPNIRYNFNKIESEVFRSAEFKTSCIVPEGVKTLSSSCFDEISAPNNTIVLPSTLTNLDGYGCVNGQYSKHLNIKILATTPPTMSASYCIGEYVDSITVPQGTLEAYQTATNWTKFADKITEESA